MIQDVSKERMQNTLNDNILTPLKYEKYFTKTPKLGKLLFQEGDIKLYSVCPQVCYNIIYISCHIYL